MYFLMTSRPRGHEATKPSSKALVRTGDTGGMPPVNSEQGLAATRQFWDFILKE